MGRMKEEMERELDEDRAKCDKVCKRCGDDFDSDLADVDDGYCNACGGTLEKRDN